jgi:hypothetical protein
MPSLSTLSKNLTDQINAFRKKQYYLTAIGSYTVTCPMIEEQFPALAGQLKLDLTLHRDWKESNGMLVAGFGFGLFSGTIAMSPDRDQLTKCCYYMYRA